MEDSFQFIIESPQHNQGHKKRPRLVTSCDNCRLKKIKCLQPSPESKCEACKTAKIPCKFKDRERYFAERSRAIAGSNVPSSYGDERRSSSNPALDAFSVASSSSSPASSHSGPRSTSHSPKASGVVCPDGSDYNSRYPSYPPDPRRATSPTSRHTPSSSISSYHSNTRGDSMGYNFIPAGPAQLLQSTHQARSPSYSSRALHLYDSDQSQRPHPDLMPHFIQLFFEQLGSEFPFLNYQEILAEFWEGTLPPLLANCIAALSARYSNLPDLAVRGLHNVSESYSETAKSILTAVAHLPNMDTLHALMLVSWLEYKNNRISSFKVYCQMAMSMAIDLGLSDQHTIQMNPSEVERNRRRSTWANIVQLHLTASSGAYFDYMLSADDSDGSLPP
ncbi:hypothetical protein EYR40_006840 [Pleurotus pulmonarius]|nr:hypothetical protein EYR40_006840 [Pleurotus pulmonarius]